MSEIIEEDQVINDLANHINILGGTTTALFNYVKEQDIAINIIANFLTVKYGEEFSEFFKDESTRLKEDIKDV